MTDIVERLRRWWEDHHASSASDLMDEAADEIARLRLTDAEREAIEHGLEQLEPHADTESKQSAAALRKLLERLA
jgi:hypothetical protein